MTDRAATSQPTLDAAEVERFARIADDWWNPDGKFRPLHQLAPARLGYLKSTLAAHFHLPADGLKALRGLHLLDIGCGGGLVCEPLARLGGRITGIDPAPENIGAARRHAAPQGLDIDYRSQRAEDLVAAGEHFDAVLCLEVVEHVPDPGRFIALIAQLVRPGGVLILSTINRTLKSYGLAIIGAEYVLRWLPVGTHQWDRFVTPEEMYRYLAAAGFARPVFQGLSYSPFADLWSLGADTDVNYFAAATKPLAQSR